VKNVNRKPLPTPSGDGRDLKSQFSGGAFCPLEEQSLRSAPSGRNSEQGLAPRSKYSGALCRRIFWAPQEFALREQTAGVEAFLWQLYRRFFAPSKKWG
ncbi:MAG: hypothetical protein IIW81_05780, partial [Oscillospiraceae bacterium]|nr:hypothetical protein [Oscillospiraceae bacterium]